MAAKAGSSLTPAKRGRGCVGKPVSAAGTVFGIDLLPIDIQSNIGYIVQQSPIVNGKYNLG
jgi:hypothetical protein